MTPRPYTLISAGEGPEILAHKGVPFKGQGVPIENPHNNYITQLRLSPDKSKFVTVSFDKSIGLYDTKEQKLIRSIKSAHKKAILDVCWVSDDTFVTVSNDNMVHWWKDDGSD